jgi:uncharacterized membrane protein YcaP (DUF421 family)
MDSAWLTAQKLWGEGELLGPVAMAVRAVAMSFVVLALIRVAGARSFGRKSSFDNVVVIMLGAIAARGVVGASPFVSTIFACAGVVAVHQILGRACVSFRWVSKVIEGDPVPLYRDGSVLHANLKRTNISESDLLQSHRLERQSSRLSPGMEAWLERNGRISFIDDASGAHVQKVSGG